MKHTKHLLVLWAALLLGAGNAWGATKTGSWNLTSTSTAWEASGNETYFSQPYGYKANNGTLVNNKKIRGKVIKYFTSYFLCKRLDGINFFIFNDISICFTLFRYNNLGW